MKKLVRFGVAMESSLLEELDRLVARRGYGNRSDALRHLVHRELLADTWQRGGVVVASISLVFDHHVRELTELLTEIQHDFSEHIVSTLHVHLDHDRCLEVVVARGPAQTVKTLADRLIGARGVLSGTLVPAGMAPAAGEKKRSSRQS